MNNNKPKINMKTVRWVEIVSRLTSDDGTTLFDMDNAMEVIQQKEKAIDEYCYIIHDRDVYEEDTDTHKKGDLKPPHVHLLLKFKKKQPQKLGYVAQWFKVPENFINCKGKSWESACLYLAHVNAPDKFQYAITDVSASFDYNEFIEEYLAELEDEDEEEDDGEDGTSKRKKKKKSPIEIVVERILKGEVREYNKTLEIDQKLLIHCSRQIDQAFKVRSEYLHATQKDRRMECVYITGPSGCGKTTFARKMADSRGLAYFVSSGSNDIMDGYGQEPCIIVDDIRPSVLGLSDLLKMLDPHLACSVKSRYKNKYLNCELVILTTVLDIDKFYANVFSEQEEPVTQLKRRCSTYIQMSQLEINISLWDKKRMRYSPPVTFRNSVLEEYVPKKKVAPEDVLQHVTETMSFLTPDLVSLNISEETPGEDREKPEPEKKSPEEEAAITDGDFFNLVPVNRNRNSNKVIDEKGEKNHESNR